MKKPIQTAIMVVISVTAVISSTAFAADNCHTFWPKVPHSCALAKVKIHPSEQADFSAFETGTGKVSASTGSNAKYVLRSVPRDTARKLRAQQEK